MILESLDISDYLTHPKKPTPSCLVTGDHAPLGPAVEGVFGDWDDVQAYQLFDRYERFDTGHGFTLTILGPRPLLEILRNSKGVN